MRKLITNGRQSVYALKFTAIFIIVVSAFGRAISGQFGFGDGAYKFLLSTHGASNGSPNPVVNFFSISIWKDVVQRDLINTIKVNLAILSETISPGISIYWQFQIYSFLYCLFIISVWSYFVVKYLDTLRKGILFVILAYITSLVMNFPDAEIIVATPLTLISCTILCKTMNTKTSLLKQFLVYVAIPLVLSEVHEISVICLFACWISTKYIHFRKRNEGVKLFSLFESIFIVTFLYIFSKTLSAAANSPTSGQLKSALLFNISFWKSHPISTLLIFIFFSSLLYLFYFELNFPRIKLFKDKNLQSFLFLLTMPILFALQVEMKSSNRYWDFVAMRWDLAIMTLALSFALPFLNVSRITYEGRSTPVRKNSDGLARFTNPFLVLILVVAPTISIAGSLTWYECRQKINSTPDLMGRDVVQPSTLPFVECQWAWVESMTQIVTSRDLPSKLLIPENFGEFSRFKVYNFGITNGIIRIEK